jgi:Flp pilus assembly pilin Flp
MNAQDRNTLLLVVIIFIVCIVALVAVLSISWRLVGGAVERTFNSIGEALQINDVDYNFEIPEIRS